MLSRLGDMGPTYHYPHSHKITSLMQLQETNQHINNKIRDFDPREELVREV